MKPRPLSIHRIILIRLIPAWLILSVIMGGLAYWLESRRVERNVFGLASDAAQHFTPAAEKALLEGSLSDHMHTLRALLNDDQFAGIRLYDQDRNALFAVWGKSDPALEEVMRGTPAAFPGPGDHRHQVVWTGRRMVVRALVSLTDPSRRTFGWFEGIYVVPPRTVESIQSRVRDTILMVLIVTTLTTWTLYPIIVVLNRATVRLSNRMLDSVTELMRVLGSAIAQQLALAHPDKVQSLLLISSWARCDRYMKDVFEHLHRMRAISTPEHFMQLLQLWIFIPAYYATHYDVLCAGRAMAPFNPMPAHAFAAQCAACSEHDVLDRLGEICAPTLITVGDVDIFTPFHCSQTMYERMPHAELLVFPGCGHAHHWEDLEAFNRKTLEFLLKPGG